MAKYVPDAKTTRWVILAPRRTHRPSDHTSTAGERLCPFCSGNESLSPDEVYRIGVGEATKPGWRVRVVKNKYPITDIHEVIVHSPSHIDTIDVLPLDQVISLMRTYRDRFRANEPHGQVLIFCNNGEHAGASLDHPHSQLVVVPRQINLDTLAREPVLNLVTETKRFVTYCPDFSQWPLEVWLAPKAVGQKFGDTSDDMLPELSRLMQDTVKRIRMVYKNPNSPVHSDAPFAFNYYFYQGSDWYIRIIPRHMHRAGFELGTGLAVNPMDPLDAAQMLQRAW